MPHGPPQSAFEELAAPRRECQISPRTTLSLTSIWNASIAAMSGAITRNYDKIHHRNKKKDDAHLNKHAMHLVRLYLMCLDILEREEIVTVKFHPAPPFH